MSVNGLVVAEFDSMADIYDSTREPATDAETNLISDAPKGCETILDVGVGTGRFAKYLVLLALLRLWIAIRLRINEISFRGCSLVYYT